jgi:hypothetical protein
MKFFLEKIEHGLGIYISDVFKLEITYCPICDVIQMFGLPDLAPYVCEADWQVAKENE